MSPTQSSRTYCWSSRPSNDFKTLRDCYLALSFDAASMCLQSRVGTLVNMRHFCTEGTTAIGERERASSDFDGTQLFTQLNSRSWSETSMGLWSGRPEVGLRSTCGLELLHPEMHDLSTTRCCYLGILVACLTPGSRLAPPDPNAREHDLLVEPASSEGARPLAFPRGTEWAVELPRASTS